MTKGVGVVDLERGIGEEGETERERGTGTQGGPCISPIFLVLLWYTVWRVYV